MEAFDEYLSSMLNRRADLQKELNTAERRISTLEKHLEQSDIFFRFSGKKKLSESDQILFDAAKRYLQGVMNGRTRIPVKAWKRELADLLDQKKLLYYKYTQLKDEVKNVEQIRRSVDSIIREEERDRARRRGQNVLS
jgi:predicted  nucleic acid-binding Zn-ribbon protein